MLYYGRAKKEIRVLLMSRIDHEKRNKEDLLRREDPNKKLREEVLLKPDKRGLLSPGRREYFIVTPSLLEANQPEATAEFVRKFGIARNSAVISSALLFGCQIVPEKTATDLSVWQESGTRNRMIEYWSEAVVKAYPETRDLDYAVAIMSRWKSDLWVYALQTSTSPDQLVVTATQVNFVLLHEREAWHLRKSELLTENTELRNLVTQKYGVEGYEAALVAALVMHKKHNRYARETKADVLLGEWCEAESISFRDLYSQRQTESFLSRWPKEAVSLLLYQSSGLRLEAEGLAKKVLEIENYALAVIEDQLWRLN